nr:legumain-like [Misgurnus anguillicaudatus]
MAAAGGKHWVMLAAGSKKWDNYRHQADVCHAYQIMHQNGIPDSQIVVMMYDDIAYNDKNPYPGKIINKPNGWNVYQKVPKDYTGQDVTPENFLAVLRGDKRAVRSNGPKKVIASGRNDTIFIYLSDHGGPGVFCFPNSPLYASDLIATIKQMAADRMFSKMVIYLEACYSGSMFTQLPSYIHVYAVTAANPIESSYACFFDPVRKTYLSNEFSAVWMHHNEKCDLNKATFQDQFGYLQKKKCHSHFCWFGDMSVGQCPISEVLKNTPQKPPQIIKARKLRLTDLTPTHEVPFTILKHRIATETDAGKRQSLIRKQESLYQARAKIERTVQAIKQRFPAGADEDEVDGDYSTSIDLQEFKTVAEHFRTTCFDWHVEEFEIALSYMQVFARLCARGVEAERIKEAITTVGESSNVLP